MTTCKICNIESKFFSEAVVLGKHHVAYFRCPSCGFIQTEPPYWLAEAYESVITNMDIGPIDRSISTAQQIRALILSSFNHRKPFLDYGAGYGILVRRMRDLGFDFKYHDAHCTNLFSKGFEGALAGTPYELITAIEVFEHLEQPRQVLEKLLQSTGSVFFTTEVLPNHIPKPDQWWYYGLAHGQHISIFSKESLNTLANGVGKNLYSCGRFHLVTDKKISARLYQTILQPNWAATIGTVLARAKGVQSLLVPDFERISNLRLTNKPLE